MSLIIKEKGIINRFFLLCINIFIFLNIYGNDSILVDKEWTERQTIFYNGTDIYSIGEDSLIENNGIGCGHSCKKIIFYSNNKFKIQYPNGKIRFGEWFIKDDSLTIIFDKRKRKEKKKYQFKIKYRIHKQSQTLYLFEINDICCYIFCHYYKNNL